MAVCFRPPLEICFFIDLFIHFIHNMCIISWFAGCVCLRERSIPKTHVEMFHPYSIGKFPFWAVPKFLINKFIQVCDVWLLMWECENQFETTLLMISQQLCWVAFVSLVASTAWNSHVLMGRFLHRSWQSAPCLWSRHDAFSFGDGEMNRNMESMD